MVRQDPARAATRLLLRQPLHSLRFDIQKLRFDKPVVFDTIQHYCSMTPANLRELSASSDTADGLTLVRRSHAQTYYIVLYNADVRNPRRRFTLAHEIGHICLGHMEDGDQEEPEADAFAAQLLMPRILVGQLALVWGAALSATELCGIFGVSRAAAQASLRKLAEPLDYSDDDYALLERFGPLLPHPGDPLITI